MEDKKIENKLTNLSQLDVGKKDDEVAICLLVEKMGDFNRKIRGNRYEEIRLNLERSTEEDKESAYLLRKSIERIVRDWNLKLLAERKFKKALS